MTFRQFIEQLDEACEKKFGMDTGMMVDLPTRRWYDDNEYVELDEIPEDEMEEMLEEVAEYNDFQL